MKLLLINHGQTDWDVAKMIKGQCDVELNYVGIEQAEKLAEKLAESQKYNIKKIYTSILQRAKRTAYIMGARLGLEVEEVEGIEEMSFGRWEGLSFEEVKKEYIDEFHEWYIEDRHNTKITGGESYDEVLERTLECLKDIIDENEDLDGDILIVTHLEVIANLQCYLNNVPLEQINIYKKKNEQMAIIDSSEIK